MSIPTTGELASSIKMIARESFTRGAVDAVIRLGKDPQDTKEVSEFIGTLDEVGADRMASLMDRIAEVLEEERAVTCTVLLTWYTAIQIHGTLEAAMQSMLKEE